MRRLKMRSTLAMMMACLAVVSLLPCIGGAAVTPTVPALRIYLTEDALANVGTVGGIGITGLQKGSDPVTGATVTGTSAWVTSEMSNIPRFGGTYRAIFTPTNSAAYAPAYFNITISQMAGYASSESGGTVGGGNLVGPQHQAKAKTTIYNTPGGSSIGSLSAGQKVEIMYITSGMACLISGGFVDFSALELVNGPKQ